MAVANTQANHAAPGAASHKWWVLISVVFGIFMVILDTTVVNVAFQALRAEFGANLTDSQWIISVYVLALGISTPLAGFLADRFGSKNIYLTGLAIFILGSFLSGISPNIQFLIVARAIQGIGGGIAMPLGSAMLFRTFPVSEQGEALGIFGIALLVAPALGPILGGFLVDHNLWRAIFFINPPIGVIGILLGSRYLPNFKGERKPSLDLLGLITECIGFGAILYAASIAAQQGWSAPGVMTSLIIGIAGLAAFAIVELFVAKDPLLDLRLYTKRIFLNANLLGYVAVIALFGAEFLMPLYLQFLRGMTAFQTGLILLPMAVTGGISTIVAGRLYDKIGPRPMVVFGYSILIINTWQLSQIKADTPISFIMLLLALRGLAVGSTVQTTFVTALSVVPMKQIARGSSLTNATRQVVQSIGIAILAAVLASALSPQITALQQQFLDQPPQMGVAPLAVCSTNTPPAAALASANPNTALSSLAAKPGVTLPPNAGQLLAEACLENVKGFESAYKITFYAALLALALGLMLPGWPRKFAGRRAADAPTVVSH
jgi:EmrB/QacA subfamily drug resistance transporter